MKDNAKVNRRIYRTAQGVAYTIAGYFAKRSARGRTWDIYSRYFNPITGQIAEVLAYNTKCRTKAKLEAEIAKELPRTFRAYWFTLPRAAA